MRPLRCGSMELPFATPEFAGIGGHIKARPEDFVVTEEPLYEPSGAGEHVLCEIQKRGLTTFDAVARLAAILKVDRRDIGYAGMKDARAVTRQAMSIRTADMEAVREIKTPELTVLWAERHVNKLRLGHLAGNRFEIKIRGVEPTAVTQIGPVMKILEKRGVPNYFGEQRFGRRNNNDLLGAALIRGDNKALAHLLLGDAQVGLDDAQQVNARRLFDAGDWQGAMKAWPRKNGMERRLLARVLKTGKASGAGRALEEHLRRLFVAALQSRVFNAVLAKRIDTYDTIIDGDWAEKTENGACFPVENVEAEQQRAAAGEISPTGPLVGFRVSMATGAAGAIEQGVLDEFQLKPEMFKVPGHYRVKGARRSLRVLPKGMEYSGGVDEHGAYVALSFMLPAGAFATVLLRELMKKAPEEAPAGDAVEGELDPMEEEDKA